MIESDEELETKAKDAVLENERSHPRPDWIARRGPFQDGYTVGYRARAAEEAKSRVGLDALCKCGCPKGRHAPHHAHTKVDAPSEFCDCFEFEAATSDAAGDRTKKAAELIATVRHFPHIEEATEYDYGVFSDVIDQLAELLGVKP